MAAALQDLLLLRRGAAVPPSLALLRPLSPGWYSLRCAPLSWPPPPGLPDVRRPQLSPAPVPPLLRYFSSKPSKGCAPPPRRQPPTSSKGTPLLEQGCTPPPRGQPSTSSEGTPCLEQCVGGVGRDHAQGRKRRKKTLQQFGDLHMLESLEGEKSKNFQQCPGIGFAGCLKSQGRHCTKEKGFRKGRLASWGSCCSCISDEEFLIGLLEDLKKVKKQSDILVEALDNCKKASALLSGRWNDKSVAMFENGLEKAFKVLLSMRNHWTTFLELSVVVMHCQRIFCNRFRCFIKNR